MEMSWRLYCGIVQAQEPSACSIERLTSVLYAIYPMTLGNATTYANVKNAVRPVQRKY